MGHRGRAGLGAAVFGLALVLSSVLAGPASASTPTTVGYRDFSYAGSAATRVTSDPEQSKLWYNAGGWWGALFVSSGTGSGGSHFNIYNLNKATHSWVDTTVRVDSRDHSHADYLWDGAANKLYAVSSKSICDTKFDGLQPCNDSIRFYRYTYHPAATTLAAKYTLDTGFPKILIGGGYTGGNFTGGGSNAITVAKDSTGKLWVAYTRDDPTTAAPPITGFNSNVHLATSADDGVTWTAPGLFAGADLGQPGQDNTAAIVTFGGNKIGLYWTDKHAAGSSPAYFAVHNDGDPDGTWSAKETVTTGTNASDNQVNLKADSTGKVYAAIKTDLTNQIQLFDRATDGTWTGHNVSTSGNGNTRAQVALDEELGLAYVFSSAGGTTDGTIYVKSAPLSTLSFPTGKGAAFIKSASDVTIDDVTTTKQTVSSATGIVAEASDRTTMEFLHNELALAASDTTPPVAGTITINNGASFTATANVTVAVPASDAGSGVQLVRLANTSDVDGSGVLSGAGATTMSWAPTVPWALAAGDGVKNVYVQFQDAAGNWSAPVTDSISLDTTGPTGTVSINGGAAATKSLNVNLDVPATDAGVGIVSNVRIANACTVTAGQLSDASAVTSAYAAAKPWTLAAGADGTRTVCAQWQDSLGNWSTPQSDTITLDTTPPAAGTVSIDETSPTADTTLHLTLTNPDGAPSVRIAESAAGIATATPQAYADHIAYPLVNTTDGFKTIYVSWEDAVGNDSAPVASGSVLLDTRAPIGHVVINNNNPGIHALAVSLSFPNTDGDVDQIHVSNSPTMAGAQTFGTVGTPFTGSVPWTLPGPLTNYAVKTVYVTFHDIAGHSSAPLSGVAYSAADSATVDLTRPTMSGAVATNLLSGTTMAGNAMRLRVSWVAGKDTITGVKSYRVLVSIDGRPYFVIGTPTSNFLDVNVYAGHKYRFVVYAVDGAVNTSLALYGPTIVAGAYQESSASLHWSTGWRAFSNPVFYANAERYSTARGTSVSLTFTGRSISWISALGPSRGQARVYVDGVLRATVNLNSSTYVYRRVVFSLPVTTGRTHTIKVIVLGTLGHPRVDVDAFGVIR